MRKLIQLIFCLGLGVVLIWFLFRNTNWQAVSAAIRGTSVYWLILSQIFAWISYFARTQRWSYVVRAAHPAANFRSLFSATQIGFLVNFTVPARIGELVRAYMLAKLAKIPLSQCMVMVALDRVNDMLALLAIIFVAVVSFPMYRDIRFAAGVFNNADPFIVSSALIQPVAISLSVLLCFIIGVLVLIYTNQTLVLSFINIAGGKISERLTSRIVELFLNFIKGMNVFSSGLDIAKSACFSAIIWGSSILSIAAILTAFTIDFPWFTPFLMLAMIAVLISFPVTPGVVGQYHIAVVACLLLVIPDINIDEAKAVAIVAHALSMIPIIVLGMFCLFCERMNFIKLIPKSLNSNGEINNV